MTALEIKAPAAVAVRERRPKGMTAILVFGVPLVVMALLAFAAPLLHLQNPNTQNLAEALRPPAWQHGGSMHHLFGTDELGRDMLARLIYGGRLTFIIAIVGVLAGAVPGIVLGLVAGYRRGWVDVVISRLVEAQLALPFILLAIAIISARGRSIGVLILVLALVGWAQYARVIRAETLSLRQRPFVSSLRCAGVPTPQILFRHILPNLAGTATVMATLQMGTIILAESALSFLGLGVAPPEISWGEMLADGRDVLTVAWWVATIPGVAITIIVLLVNLFGDALRSRVDPKKRGY